tara:strand:+ start:317 stop:1261 length:945 start_codon:yes stop_codon:yes gene_type:complete
MTTEKVPFSSKKYHCDICDYNTSRKSQFDRHILTAKHKNNEKYNQIKEKSSDFSNNVINFVCECGKSYPYRGSLFNHKKKCNFKSENTQLSIVENNDLKEDNEELKGLVCKLITENNEIKNTILKENQELRAQVNELIPKIGNNNTTNIKQKFNINVFLNEKCKDAININDFIKSIEISLEQLDFTKQKGLSSGLSNAIVENMNKLSVYERPLHCTDVKRETLYIKEDDEWSKDGSKEKIKKAIKKVSNKNYNALQEWKSQNPDFLVNTEKQDYFTKTISTIGKPISTIDEKVIKNLCKETYVKNINEENGDND